MKHKYVRKIAEKHPYDYENPPICKVELWDFSRANENEEARKEAVCLVASISYGNEYCKDPNKLWNLLVTKGHESPFEFVREAPYWEIDDDYKIKVETTDCLGDDTLRSRVFGYSSDEDSFVRDTGYPYAYATFKLKVPIFVARQIMRHRSFSFLEMSRRYVKSDKVEFEFWYGKDEIVHPDIRVGSCRMATVTYEHLISEGWKSEQSRAFLLLGLYTVFWMQGDYRAWLNFFIHRLHPEAQDETRLVVQVMWELLKEHQPEIRETMRDYLEEWTIDCNPIFTPAREKRAEWFKETFLV